MDGEALNNIYDNCFIANLSKVSNLNVIFEEINYHFEDEYNIYISNDYDLYIVLKSLEICKLLDKFNFNKKKILKIVNHIFLDIGYEKHYKNEYSDDIYETETINFYESISSINEVKNIEFSNILGLYFKYIILNKDYEHFLNFIDILVLLTYQIR